MKLGIRVQLILALIGLLTLAFVPLYLAVASLTQSTMLSVRESSARSLGRAIAGHIVDAREQRDATQLEPLLAAEIGTEGLQALAIYDERGRLLQSVGDFDSVEIPERVPPDMERVTSRTSPHGRSLEVLLPGRFGPVMVWVKTDEASMGSTPLVRLVALYMVLFALALIVFLYIALTRLIVQPILDLSSAAQRVTEGARELEASRGGARELSDLGGSLAVMMRKLRSDEQSLRTKVDELERASRELETAHTSLIRSERLASVGRLAAGLAHEIGNPIAAILGFQELLIDESLTREEERDFLRRMKKETERINRVLRQLLDYARPTEPKKSLGEIGSVNEALTDATALMVPQKGYAQIILVSAVQEDLSKVPLSLSQLTQVLVNLLMNAADATQGKGNVHVRATQADNRIMIEVEDDGPGVSPDVADTLFEPFVTTKDVGKGTGLGLAVCKGLIEAGGGSISVERGPMGGALFRIELPALEHDDQL